MRAEYEAFSRVPSFKITTGYDFLKCAAVFSFATYRRRGCCFSKQNWVVLHYRWWWLLLVHRSRLRASYSPPAKSLEQRTCNPLPAREQELGGASDACRNMQVCPRILLFSAHAQAHRRPSLMLLHRWTACSRSLPLRFITNNPPPCLRRRRFRRWRR